MKKILNSKSRGTRSQRLKWQQKNKNIDAQNLNSWFLINPTIIQFSLARSHFHNNFTLIKKICLNNYLTENEYSFVHGKEPKFIL